MNILDPIWEGNEIYRETICYAYDSEGNERGGTLLYYPKKVLSVTLWDGKTELVEGKDYIVRGKQIVRLPESRIPLVPREHIIKEFHGEPELAWFKTADGKHRICIDADFYKYQMLVSYKHDGQWQGEKPVDQSRNLPITMEKLRNSDKLNLVFYGDSITVGWESSGCVEHAIALYDLTEHYVVIDHAPNVPNWAEQVTEAMRSKYLESQIVKTNRAAGGAITQWGVDNTKNLVNTCNPDLVIVSFGMNCMADPAEKFKADFESIIGQVREEFPKCEFVLVSPMVANMEMNEFQNSQLAEHEKVLYELAREHRGIAVAPVHTIFKNILKQGKQYLELSGDCINHPNDYSARVYAQVILKTMGI